MTAVLEPPVVKDNTLIKGVITEEDVRLAVDARSGYTGALSQTCIVAQFLIRTRGDHNWVVTGESAFSCSEDGVNGKRYNFSPETEEIVRSFGGQTPLEEALCFVGRTISLKEGKKEEDVT